MAENSSAVESDRELPEDQLHIEYRTSISLALPRRESVICKSEPLHYSALGCLHADGSRRVGRR